MDPACGKTQDLFKGWLAGLADFFGGGGQVPLRMFGGVEPGGDGFALILAEAEGNEAVENRGDFRLANKIAPARTGAYIVDYYTEDYIRGSGGSGSGIQCVTAAHAYAPFAPSATNLLPSLKYVPST